MSNYAKISDAIHEFLEKRKALSSKKAVSGKEIKEHLDQRIEEGSLDVTLSDSTIVSYISTVANYDDDSRVQSGGPYGGYWLERLDEAPVAATTAASSETAKELQLYPLVEAWLGAKGYTSKDVSTGKKGGKWGNPDIVGVRRTELLGAVEIETVSCEVKLSNSYWEQFIFEAISHKRFCTRSWYCYRVADAKEPLPKGMDYYSERYRIGIVRIVLSEAELGDLSKLSDIDKLDRVVEVIPAVYEPVGLMEKKDLINRFNLSVSVTFD